MNERKSEVSQGITDWERRLIGEVFKGPSANLPEINRLCHHAWKDGLLPDGKFGLVKEIAELMYFAQPDGLPPNSLARLDLEQIAKEIGREFPRVQTVAGLMAEFGLIPNTKSL